MRDMLLVAAGLLAIYAELLRPRGGVAGAAGGVLLMLGVAEIARTRPDPHALLWVGGPMVVLTAALLRIAIRARMNKRTFR